MSQQKIGKVNTNVRLFERDLKHIKSKIKIEGNSDTRFKDTSASIRHYVHIGIITEKRTETANTLDDRIIKASQKEVVSDSLMPLKNAIDGLMTAMENFEAKQDSHFKESNHINNIVVWRLENLNETVIQGMENLNNKINSELNKILDSILTTGKIGEETYRNVIVLRSVYFVFLLGFKTGRIKPSDRTPWEKIIGFAHRKAQELSIEELKTITDGTYNNSIVQKLAAELFDSLKPYHQKSQNE